MEDIIKYYYFTEYDGECYYAVSQGKYIALSLYDNIWGISHEHGNPYIPQNAEQIHEQIFVAEYNEIMQPFNRMVRRHGAEGGTS